MFDGKEMIIIRIKHIVTVGNLTICSVQTCILIFSLLALQRTIRIYAAVLEIKFDSVIPDMPEMKDSGSKFIINLKVLTVKPK